MVGRVRVGEGKRGQAETAGGIHLFAFQLLVFLGEAATCGLLINCSPSQLLTRKGLPPRSAGDCGLEGRGWTMNVPAALKSQYHAALAMLKQAIDRCPDDLWTAQGDATQFWQVAYHAIFYTHLYLQPDEQAFHPWESHREEYQFLEAVPWPPHRSPRIGEPYSKALVLEYWQVCDAMIDCGVDQLDLDAGECGFSWYEMPKLEHQMMNIRHIQHHAAQLAERIRSATGMAADWIGNEP